MARWLASAIALAYAPSLRAMITGIRPYARYQRAARGGTHYDGNDRTGSDIANNTPNMAMDPTE